MTSSNTSTAMPEPQSDETELQAETNHTMSSQSNEIHSGVGVLDKTVKILDALESGPATLGQLVSSTGPTDRASTGDCVGASPFCVA